MKARQSIAAFILATGAFLLVGLIYGSARGEAYSVGQTLCASGCCVVVWWWLVKKWKL
jgi:hypothetical protein